MYARNLNEQQMQLGGAYERRMAQVVPNLKLDYSDCKINEVLAFIGNEHVNSSVFLKFDWSTGKIEKIVSGMFLEYEYSHGLNEPRRGGCCDFLKEDKKTLGKLHVMNYGSLNIYKVTLDGYKDKEFIEEFINEWFPLYRYSRSAKL